MRPLWPGLRFLGEVACASAAFVVVLIALVLGLGACVAWMGR